MSTTSILNKKSIAFLESYLNNASPTGFEAEGQKIWMDYVKPYVDTFITDKHNGDKLKAFLTQMAYEKSIKGDEEVLREAKDAVTKATPKVPVEPATAVATGAAGGGHRRTHRKKSKKSKKKSRRQRSKVPRSA